MSAAWRRAVVSHMPGQVTGPYADAACMPKCHRENATQYGRFDTSRPDSRAYAVQACARAVLGPGVSAATAHPDPARSRPATKSCHRVTRGCELPVEDRLTHHPGPNATFPAR